MGIVSILEPWEIELDIAAGKFRQSEAVRQGRLDSHDFPNDRDPEQTHINGVHYERAFAKSQGILDWVPTVNTFQRGFDVGNYQVRGRSKSNLELMIRTNAHDDDVYVLVRGRCPTYKVVGWILAADAKRPEWLKPYADREPAYFVPDRFLHEMDSLPT